MDRLTPAVRQELAELARRYGEPTRVTAVLPTASFDPLNKADRFGEVAMVIRRPSGSILLSTKDFYPAGAYRIPTGGISHGERVYDALLRESHEETGLEVEPRRFLAWIDYDVGGETVFHTFAFLLDERGGTLGTLDPHERIAGYREVASSELGAVAARLGSVTAEHSSDIGGSWRDWGIFRAAVHRAVAEAMRDEAAP
jgi:ADP-ribose pyrophosphatase YjhB (NUDIX family)